MVVMVCRTAAAETKSESGEWEAGSVERDVAAEREAVAGAVD